MFLYKPLDIVVSKTTFHLSQYDIMKIGWGSQSAKTKLLPWRSGSSSALTQVSLQADWLSDPAEIFEAVYLSDPVPFCYCWLLQQVVAAEVGFAEGFFLFCSWPGWPQLLRE